MSEKIKVSIIGVGLIGGSLGMALRASGLYRVTGIGRHIKRLKKAKASGAVDFFTLDMKEGVKDADIVVICTPVDMIARTVKELLPFVKDNAVITDAGSVKAPILREVEKVFSMHSVPRASHPVFIGAHPMAGTEKAGIDNAFKTMYKGACAAVTPGKRADKAAVSRVKKMWENAGARVVIMNETSHDKTAAVVSHLPHVIAFSMAKKAGALNKNSNARDLIAGSFRDMTRVAASNPDDWARICHENREELGAAIDGFVKMLGQAKKNLGSVPRLRKIFGEGKAARQKLLNIKG